MTYRRRSMQRFVFVFVFFSPEATRTSSQWCRESFGSLREVGKSTKQCHGSKVNLRRNMTSPSKLLIKGLNVINPFTPKYILISEVVRIGCGLDDMIVFHLIKLWRAKFFVVCDVILLLRLQEKFDIDHWDSTRARDRGTFISLGGPGACSPGKCSENFANVMFLLELRRLEWARS